MANKPFRHPPVCVLMKDLHTKGIFHNDNPLDHIFPVFIFQFILFVVISRTLHFILRPLKQSRLVCNILAGIILGPSVLGRNKTYMDTIFAEKEMIVTGTVSALSVALSVFLTYIKMDGSLLTKSGKKTWTIGLSCMIISFLFTAVVVFLLSLFLPSFRNTKTSLHVQFIIVSSLNFFIVIANGLDELNILSSELGQLAISISTLSEIVSGLVIVVTLIQGIEDGRYKLYAFILLCVVITFIVVVMRPILHWIIERTPSEKLVKECYVTAIMLVTLLLGMITEVIGANSLPVAMVMGFIIPNKPPLGSTMVKKCELLISECFLPFFFVRIGYFTNISAIKDLKESAAIGAFFLAAFLGKLVGSLVASSYFNMKRNFAVLLSLILSLHGLMELIYVIVLKHKEQIDDQGFTTFVIGIVISHAIITPMIEIFYVPTKENLDCSSTLHPKSIGMTSIIGELRIIACVEEEDNVPSIISLLKALNPNEVSPVCAYVIHLVAVATQTVPTFCPYKNHKRIFSNPSSCDKIMQAFLNYAENSNGPVQIQPFRMISPIKYMYQPICRLVETTMTPLIIVPLFESNEAPSIDGTLRNVSSNIQEFAKCTVGILVDRGLQTRRYFTSFSYNMAVIFIGGADDREALFLATRISKHPNIAITIYRIHVRGNQTLLDFETKQEKEIDEIMLREFKSVNITNANVVCNEFEAHGSEEVLRGLHSIGNNYDLVVVGKRHEILEFEHKLLSWTEYPELGVIGDAIAAPDFHGGNMSILVLKRHRKKEISVSFSC